jgi:LmbE family N-acetylglucosaminyl deacetylase
MPSRSPLTLMAVHAHPDDEAISTGGILARYSLEGVRTVLVTCTDGSCGDGPKGVKPGDAGHDRASVAEMRRDELERSCAALGISDLEMLGYRDSGMMGWPTNDEPGSFWTLAVEEPAARIAELMRRYRPQVIVTYNENGFYGHPDHIQAHRATMAAVSSTDIPEKVYFTAVPRSRFENLGERLRELGIEEPRATSGNSGGSGPRVEWGTPDEQVTTWIDVSKVADRKWESLRAHASQADNIFFLRMGREVFRQVMGSETFVRALDRSGAPVPEDDLFAGLR